MRARALAILAPLLAVGACASPPAQRNAGGAATIVSLNPCADAILAEVAAPGQLLAISHYSHDPRASSMPLAEARRFTATGGTVEEIAALAPRIVVGDTFTPPAMRDAIARMGMRFHALPIATDVAASAAQVRDLARLAGQPVRGEALVARIARSWREASPLRGHRAPTALVWQGGGLVAGDDSLIAQLMAHVGLRPTAAARGLGQGAVLPLEAMLADPPQLVLATGDSRASEDRLLRHPVLERLAVHRLDPSLLYCGGPTIPRALSALAAIRDGAR